LTLNAAYWRGNMKLLFLLEQVLVRTQLLLINEYD